MRKIKPIIQFALITLTLTGCGSDKNQADGTQTGESVEVLEPDKVPSVKVMPLRYGDFSYDHISNGKAASHDAADLYFGTDAVVTEIPVSNGMHVRRGQVLARCDTFRLATALRQREIELARAELEVKDQLISQGYDPDRPELVPASVMDLARLRSGYAQAVESRDLARRDLTDATLRAPFDGTVSNLVTKPFNRPASGKPFCSISGNGMEIDFTILESELGVIKPGDPVEVTPYSRNQTYTGRVTRINPSVDTDGLVRVTASVSSPAGLYDGMNVRVRIRRIVPDQLTVPKSAVVLRTGKPVVFTLDETGKRALWNYVTLGLESLTDYTITDGLTEGMTVITEGNVNLAHESAVNPEK